MAEVRKLTAEEQAALNAVRDRPDEEIDLTDPDAPEVTDWAGAVRGALRSPVGKPVAMTIDADVLAWFRSRGDGYRAHMNEALREHMERHKGRG